HGHAPSAHSEASSRLVLPEPHPVCHEGTRVAIPDRAPRRAGNSAHWIDIRCLPAVYRQRKRSSPLVAAGCRPGFLSVRGLGILPAACWLVATPLGARGQDAALAPSTTSNGGTVLADARLHAALDRLARLPEGAVLDRLAAAGVRIEVGAVPADDWAASFLTEGRIVVNPDVLGADPRAIAALIAHAATHRA